MNSSHLGYHPELITRAFELAEKGRGTVHPNPMVGAVIAKGSSVIAQGWHERAGGPHAEVAALKEASTEARGADLYVSLEPCCHQGRTPPCTSALIDAGIARVFIGALDPDKRVDGRGIEVLREAGLLVQQVGVPPEFVRQNEVYFKYAAQREPFVLLKVAMSLNGKIGASAGTQTRITGARAGELVHSLRGEFPAIAVGVDTAIIDDPLLTCRSRDRTGAQPIRIVIDSGGRLPLTSRLIQTIDQGPVWLATTSRLSAKNRRAFEQAGLEIIACRANDQDRVDLKDLWRQLGEREIVGLLVEGGAAINESILSAGLADKLLALVSPTILGGPDSVPLIREQAGFARSLKMTDVRFLGEDLMIEAYPVEEVVCSQE